MGDVTFHAKMFPTEINPYKKYFNALPSFYPEKYTCEGYRWMIRLQIRISAKGGTAILNTLVQIKMDRAA